MKCRSSYSIKQFLLPYIAWWVLWAIVHLFVLHHMGLSWRLSLVDSIVSNILLALACLSSVILYQFYQPGANARIYQLVFAVGITILFCSSIKYILVYLHNQNENYISFLEDSIPIRFVFSFLMFSFVTLLNWLRNNMIERSLQETRRIEAEQLVKEAELVKLRQQLQPHFLFNSLNSISALAGSKPNEARKMILQLSDFLRGTLKKDEQQTVGLREELKHLELYLEIEKVRFGQRLNIYIEINDSAIEAQIPPLLLQPIVENAIKFGLYGTIDSVTVSVEANIQQGLLFVEIKNPFDEQIQGYSAGTGFGLSSIQRRLFLLYSRADLLGTQKNNGMFITTLKIPQFK